MLDARIQQPSLTALGRHEWRVSGKGICRGMGSRQPLLQHPLAARVCRFAIRQERRLIQNDPIDRCSFGDTNA